MCRTYIFYHSIMSNKAILLFVMFIRMRESAAEESAESLLLQSTECSSQRVLCYDCDSRYDNICDDSFEESKDLKPRHRLCHGCCLKHVHTFANEERIVRSCSEKLVLRYFTPGCMNMGTKGVMCFCQGNFCNGALNHTMENSKTFLIS